MVKMLKEKLTLKPSKYADMAIFDMLSESGASLFAAQDDITERHQQMAVHIYILSSVLVSPVSLRAKVMSAYKDIQSDLMPRSTFPPTALLILTSHYV